MSQGTSSGTIQLADVSDFTEQIHAAADENDLEKDFREDFEETLSEVLDDLGIGFNGVMEKAVELDSDTEVRTSTRRADMMFGRVITEYKRPNRLASESEFDDAVEQAEDYMEGLAEEYGEPLESYVGIVLDGRYVGFISYDAEDDAWIVDGRKEVTPETTKLLLEYYRANHRYPLDPELLEEHFGAESEAALSAMRAFYHAMDDPSDEVQDLFEEWNKLFAQTIGTEDYQYPGLQDLSEQVGIELTDDVMPRWFFAVHTYYALFTKLLSAELLTIQRGDELNSYIGTLEDADSEELNDHLEDLENGEIYREMDVSNFLEGDFFGWYLEEWNDDIYEGVSGVVDELRRFEPATPVLDPERVKDLLKKLYQYLVPEEIRHDMGEYYTPDWLAEYVIRRTGYDGQLVEDISTDDRDPAIDTIPERILDPHCGSGTFLILAIQEIRDNPANADLSDSELLKLITQNVVGMDLNPLAVLSARANLLFALSDLISDSDDEIQLPIYLNDTLDSPEVQDSGNYEHTIDLTRGKLCVELPQELVESNFEAFCDVMQALEKVVINEEDHSISDESLNELEDVLRTYGLSVDNCLPKLEHLANQLISWDELWARTWSRIARNWFVAATIGEFEYVVGNPAWLRWSRLPETYRERAKEVCQSYDIFSSDAWVGGVESDISTALLYAAADEWLKGEPGEDTVKGQMGYLITQSVFKSRSAEGFRRFYMPDGTPLKVLSVDDMVHVKPFEGANNRTAALFLRKGEDTTYPVPYRVWERPSRVTIDTDSELPEVLATVNITNHEAAPVDRDGNNIWIDTPVGEVGRLKQLIGEFPYKGRKGTTTDLNNLFWIELLDEHSTEDWVKFKNNLFADDGRTKDIPGFEGWIEDDLVYPLLRGRDIDRFNVDDPDIGVILPQEGMAAYDRDKMEADYPKAMDFFDYEGGSSDLDYPTLLKERSSYKRYEGGIKHPWGVWNVGDYTFAPYKVVWPEVSKNFYAAVSNSAEMDYLGEKTIVPDHKLMFVAFHEEDAAHYVCGFINSSLIREFVESLVVETQIGARILDEIRIPTYDPDAESHQKLSQLSKDLHSGDQILTDDVEEELDELVREAIGTLEEEQKEQATFDQVTREEDELVDDILGELSSRSVAAQTLHDHERDLDISEATFTLIDLETTGFSAPYGDRIVEIGARKIRNGEVVDEYHQVVDPCRPIPSDASAVHGILDEDVREEPMFAEIADDLVDFIGDTILVSHHAEFEKSFIGLQLDEAGKSVPDCPFVNTVSLSRKALGTSANDLETLAQELDLDRAPTHRAFGDVEALHDLFEHLIETLEEQVGVQTLGDLVAIQDEALRLEAVDTPTIDGPWKDFVESGEWIEIVYSNGDDRKSKIKSQVRTFVPGKDVSYLRVKPENAEKDYMLRSDRIVDHEILRE